MGIAKGESLDADVIGVDDHEPLSVEFDRLAGYQRHIAAVRAPHPPRLADPDLALVVPSTPYQQRISRRQLPDGMIEGGPRRLKRARIAIRSVCRHVIVPGCERAGPEHGDKEKHPLSSFAHFALAFLLGNAVKRGHTRSVGSVDKMRRGRRARGSEAAMEQEKTAGA